MSQFLSILFVLSLSVISTTAFAESEEQLAAIDGHEFIPTRGMDKCGAFFNVKAATMEVEVTFTGGECLQSHTVSLMKCPEDNKKCKGEITWEGCGDRYGHRLGNECLDENGDPMPMDEVEGWAMLRIFSGAKKVSLTIKNLSVNGHRVNQSSTIFTLKRKPEK